MHSRVTPDTRGLLWIQKYTYWFVGIGSLVEWMGGWWKETIEMTSHEEGTTRTKTTSAQWKSACMYLYHTEMTKKREGHAMI